MRKSPAGFITLEVTAEVRINTKLKIRISYLREKWFQFQFQREIYCLAESVQASIIINEKESF